MLTGVLVLGPHAFTSIAECLWMQSTIIFSPTVVVGMLMVGINGAV